MSTPSIPAVQTPASAPPPPAAAATVQGALSPTGNQNADTLSATANRVGVNSLRINLGGPMPGAPAPGLNIPN